MSHAFKNAQIIYDETKDILTIRNCQARNKCVNKEEGKYGITRYFDIAEKPCILEIPDASITLGTGKDFLSKFTYYDLT